MEKIDNFLKEVLPDEEYERFDNMSDDEKAEWWKQNKSRFKDEEGFIDVYGEAIKAAPADIVKDIPPELMSENLMYDLASKYNIDAGTLRKEYERIQADKKYQKEREERKKEIEGAGLFSPWTLASEYSKQRYIDDPDNSIFGKQGKFNPWSREGAMDISDAVFGTVGAIGDALPKGLSLLGTGARTARDLTHKLYDSDYQKTAGEIVKDAGVDMALNAGPEAVLGGLDAAAGKIGAKGYLGRAKNLMAEEKNISKGFEELKKAGIYTRPDYRKINRRIDKMLKNGGWTRNRLKILEARIDKIPKFDPAANTHAAMSRAVEKMPDSPLKEELKTLTAGPDYDKKKAAHAIASWGIALDDFPKRVNLYMDPGYGKDLYEKHPMVYDYLKTRLDAPTGIAERAMVKTADVSPGLLREAANVAGAKNGSYRESDKDKLRRWKRGYATWDEKQSKEYQDFVSNALKGE